MAVPDVQVTKLLRAVVFNNFAVADSLRQASETTQDQVLAARLSKAAEVLEGAASAVETILEDLTGRR